MLCNSTEGFNRQNEMFLPSENRKNAYVFRQQMSVGKRAENLFVWFMSHQKNKNVNIKKIIDVSGCAQYQNKDIDFLVQNGDAFETWEVKNDTYTTNRIFAEEAVVTYKYDKTTKEILSRTSKLGWLRGSAAQYVFYFFETSGEFVILSLPHFSAWIDYVLSKEYRNDPKNVLLRFPQFTAKNIPEKEFYTDSVKQYYVGKGMCVPVRDILASPIMKGYFFYGQMPPDKIQSILYAEDQHSLCGHTVEFQKITSEESVTQKHMLLPNGKI